MHKLLTLLALCSLSVCAADWRESWNEVGAFVTVSADNVISPPNTVAAISDVAIIAAQSQANAVKADLLEQATAESEAKADAFEAVIQAREGTLWIDAFNVLRIGERAVSPETGVTAEIVRFEPMVSTDGTYFVNRTFAYFSRDPGYTPTVRIGQNLAATNEWSQATVTGSYLTNSVLIAGTLYDSLFVTEFTTPVAWSNAFARVVSEVRGATTNQTLFAVQNGIEVQGESPLTLIATSGTNEIRIIGGVWCLPR